MSEKFTPKVRAILSDLSRSSYIAQAIVDRLQSMSSSEEDAKDKEIAHLKKQIIELTRLIDMLQDDDDEVPMTEEQEESFAQRFRASLTDTPYSVLVSVYTDEYFKKYPKNIRRIMATELCSRATAKNAEPLKLWYDIMAHDGSLT